MFPVWLHLLSIITLIAGGVSAGVVAADETRHPQHMWIMNILWTTTALFGGPHTLWLYFQYGRLRTEDRPQGTRTPRTNPARGTEPPLAVMVAKGPVIAVADA